MISKIGGSNKDLITKNPKRAKNFENLLLKLLMMLSTFTLIMLIQNSIKI